MKCSVKLEAPSINIKKMIFLKILTVTGYCWIVRMRYCEKIVTVIA